MTFYRLEPDKGEGRRVDFRTIFHPDGSVAVPRHVIDATRIPSHHYHTQSNAPGKIVELTRTEDSSQKRLMLLKDVSKQPGTEIPLAVNCEGLVHVQAATFVKAGIGIVANDRSPDPDSYQCRLTLLHVDPLTYVEKGRVVLGPCPTVYDFLAASEAVWAKNR